MTKRNKTAMNMANTLDANLNPANANGANGWNDGGTIPTANGGTTNAK